MVSILIEISLFLLTLSTLGAYRTFQGKTILDVILASMLIIFNFFTVMDLLKDWSGYKFFLVLSSVFLILFFIYKLLFNHQENEEVSHHFKLSPFAIFSTIILIVLGSLYFKGSIAFNDVMSIENIPKKSDFENTKHYNQKLNRVNFKVGEVTLQSYNADKNLATLSLEWLSGVNDKLSSNLEDKSITLILSNRQSQKIFGEIGSTIDFYANISYKKKEYQLIDTFLLYLNQKIMIKKNKDTPTIAYNDKWNPLIYKGKRSYTTYSDQKIKDNYTGLIWQKSGSSSEMEWKDAEAYCSNLGMRLPTLNELYYLSDRSRKKEISTINRNYFNIAHDINKIYWTATKYTKDTSQSWVVSFNYGSDYLRSLSSNYFVRCVQ